MNPPIKHDQHIIIIGGGIIGLACAHYLSDHDIDILVIDQDGIGSGASHGNCGLLHFSGVIPLCAPGVISNEIFRMFSSASPLYIKPGLDFKLYYWLTRFALNCNPSHKSHGSAAKTALLKYSLDLFLDLFALDAFTDKSACELEKQGLVLAFKDPKKFEAYKKTNDWLAKYGFGGTAYPNEKLGDLEPCLKPHLAGAWLNSHDWHLRPDTLMKTWRNHLSQKGVRFLEYAKAQDFLTNEGRIQEVVTPKGSFKADTFVMATGAWAGPMASLLDTRIPVQPGKGYSLTMERPDPCPSIPCLLYERNMVVTPWESGYRLGGTMEFSGFNSPLHRKRLDRLIEGSQEYLSSPPGSVVTEEWTGLRPMTSDDLPVIDRSGDYSNLFIATGHGMLGITMATGTGKAITDMILENTLEIDMEAFSAKRF